MNKKRPDPSPYQTDKNQTHYLPNYEEHFSPLADKPINLLELGLLKDGSMLMWRDYFKNGNIIGLDANSITIPDSTGRIHTYQGQQEDTQVLKKISEAHAPQGFDIIIDDCAHIGEFARASFWYLFENHLSSGGIYVIEDWGTGYWNEWPDGHQYKEIAPLVEDGRQRYPSHDFGMVGFVKELIDECGRDDIVARESNEGPKRSSKIKKMVVYHSHCFIYKK